MIHFIQLQNVPIFEQLQLEERLLRADDRNFCIVNYGSPRAIVMGLSNKPSELLHLDALRDIPVIKRFSGGGTVVVDPSTLFVTFIMNKDPLDVAPFPEPILRKFCDLYVEAWQIPGFQLKENDYCIGDKKCGGNAQYIRKDRYLHHTSFLWDYSKENMRLLRLPPKRPTYRQDRPHEEFLDTLRRFGSCEMLIEKLKSRLYMKEFDPKTVVKVEYRASTCLIDPAVPESL